MDVRVFELFKKLEDTVGTHKLLKCICLGGIGFLMGMILLQDDPKLALPELQNNENNKEEF